MHERTHLHKRTHVLEMACVHEMTHVHKMTHVQGAHIKDSSADRIGCCTGNIYKLEKAT